MRANMYTYTAAGTGLDACLPPWTEDGGYPALVQTAARPGDARENQAEVKVDSDKWENLYLAAGSPDKILLVRIQIRKTEAAHRQDARGSSKDARQRSDRHSHGFDRGRRIAHRHRLLPHVRREREKGIAKPWISFGSDEASQAPEAPFLKSNPHPRAYGNFARVLGKYVRDEKVLSLSEAIHRLSGLPATNLGLDHRGFLKEGMFADVVVFDPATITDHATFEKPHQYATGMKHVFVNGVQVIKNGEHTGAKPGRALWGPGKVK